METSKCELCGELFWGEWGICQECQDADSKQASEERCIRQHIEYLDQQKQKGGAA